MLNSSMWGLCGVQGGLRSLIRMGDCKEEREDLTMGRQYGEYRIGMEMEVLLEGSHHRAGGGESAEGGAWRGS